jgi:hypothetical protein
MKKITVNKKIYLRSIDIKKKHPKLFDGCSQTVRDIIDQRNKYTVVLN